MNVLVIKNTEINNIYELKMMIAALAKKRWRNSSIRKWGIDIALGHQQQPEHEDEKHILKCAVNENLIKLINKRSFFYQPTKLVNNRFSFYIL